MTGPSLYINRTWIDGQGEPFTSQNPATGQTLWSGKAASDDQVNLAITAAQVASESWSTAPLETRIGFVRDFAQQLTNHKSDLAETISQDTGKPLWESLTEVNAMIGKVDLSITAYHERHDTTERQLNGTIAATRYKPHGVCAVFGPFNLPGHLPNGHIIPALITGNTIVFKPSEQTPLVAQHMMQLWNLTELPKGIPGGVINMVQGAVDTGVALSQHPGLDGLFFTGSSRVGVTLARQFADHPGKILALEMGGNNPLIVWDTHDIPLAAYLTAQSAFITSGQRCTCARRLIIPRGARGDTLLDALQDQITRIRIGAYTDTPEPFMGPLISPQAAQNALHAQHTLVQQGGRILVEMKPTPGFGFGAAPAPRPGPGPGHIAMLTPGVIDVTPIPDLPDEEVFAPLLRVIRVPDFDTALDHANRTRYGLAASLISDDRDLYNRFYQRIRAGVVNWNRPTTGASGSLPFGGIGFSGNHRPSGYHAVDYCTYPVATLTPGTPQKPGAQSSSTFHTLPGIDPPKPAPTRKDRS